MGKRAHGVGTRGLFLPGFTAEQGFQQESKKCETALYLSLATFICLFILDKPYSRSYRARVAYELSVMKDAV